MEVRNAGDCDGFDNFAGQRWIYPNNMPTRGYQKAAVELALFNNAMIVLPTGFGKTFIAAVVMYNFYRWYPRGTVIFVAPTKPLVAQQIDECKKISGIPKADCAEVTGILGPTKREALYTSKRVLFATPQVIENDLMNDLLHSKTVKCIVIDEAHRAQGNYSYVNIVQHLHAHNKDGFRVLALSATPGSDIQRVQQVIQNLFINEVLFRSENSIDLIPFRNQKSSKAWTVELTGKHKQFVEQFIKITSPFFKELHRAGLTFHGDSIERVSKFTLIKAMQGANNNEVARQGMARGRLKFVCASAVALSSKFELLTLYGIRVFYSSITRALAEPKSALKTCLHGKIEFDKMMSDIKTIFGEDIEPDPDRKARVDLLQGHPKLVVVKDLIMKHFQAHGENKETRVIVFTKYRESVNDIVQTLRAYEPVIKAAGFVGQGTAAKTGSGMKQREQIELIKNFKAGMYNVLVATCVAEEGLDIGEVDLIICYDSSSSPISTTQRRGRTGRKRTGNVETICTKGYEEKRLQKAGASRRQVEEQLFNKSNYVTVRYRNAPRLVPLDVHPIFMEHKLYPPQDDESDEEPKPKRRRCPKNQATNGFESASKLLKKKGKLIDEPTSDLKKPNKIVPGEKEEIDEDISIVKEVSFTEGSPTKSENGLEEFLSSSRPSYSGPISLPDCFNDWSDDE